MARSKLEMLISLFIVFHILLITSGFDQQSFLSIHSTSLFICIFVIVVTLKGKVSY